MSDGGAGEKGGQAQPRDARRALSFLIAGAGVALPRSRRTADAATAASRRLLGACRLAGKDVQPPVVQREGGIVARGGVGRARRGTRRRDRPAAARRDAGRRPWTGTRGTSPRSGSVVGASSRYTSIALKPALSSRMIVAGMSANTHGSCQSAKCGAKAGSSASGVGPGRAGARGCRRRRTARPAGRPARARDRCSRTAGRGREPSGTSPC